MVKSRMSALDVHASVLEMESVLVGLRLLNIYDLSPSMFLLKFGHGEDKRMLLIENGVRAHLTELTREKPRLPSQFTLKLRKHIRAWRLSAVTQLHHDRTIDFCFGAAGRESCFHIVVELFAKGNIILTDHQYTILMLLRTHKDKDVQLVVRGIYPASEPVPSVSPPPEKGACSPALPTDRELIDEWTAIFERAPEHESLKGLLAGFRHLGQSFAEHILASSGVKNGKKKSLMAAAGTEPADAASAAQALFVKLLPTIREALILAHQPLKPGGYLITRDAQPSASGAGPVNEDFSPILLAQHPEPTDDGAWRVTFCASFGQLCDRFFLPSESERIAQHNEKNKGVVLSKRQRFELDHQRRINHLESEEALNAQKGELILLNAEKVDQAIELMNGVLAAGIPWDALRALLKRRHAEGHPVAYLIHDLMLEQHAITLLLEQPLDDDDAEDADVQPVVVQIDLARSAHANAAVYFGKMKASQAKLARTIAATATAAAGATRKGERVAARQQAKKAIVVERRRGWWERLNWFLTSAGDVVLQGKDLPTTERLIRRGMRCGDIFVQCEAPGALPCLLRPMGAAWRGEEDTGAAPVRLTSLAEAGGWCVSRSAAWRQKQSLGAWWVYGSQLTGGTAAGCYLWEGEKHHLAPQPLSLGVGLLFQLAPPAEGAAEPPDEAAAEIAPRVWPHLLSREQVDESQAWIDYIPADPARALHTLPELETRRPVRGVGPAIGTESGAAQNNKADTKAAAVTTTTPTTLAPGATTKRADPLPARGQPTKYQLKKMRKIKAKYADQDDEDRQIGARLNGNHLARVQQAELAVAAVAAQLAKAEAREVRRAERAKGTLSYHVLSPSALDDRDDEDKDSGASHELEDVSEFTEDEINMEVSGAVPAPSGEASVTASDDVALYEMDGQTSKGVDVGAAGKSSSSGPRSPDCASSSIPNHETQKATFTSLLPTLPAASWRAKKVPDEDLTTVRDVELKTAVVRYTARPTLTDVVEYAVAVCAPFSALVDYAFRVELTCALSCKKEQIAKSILQVFKDKAQGKAKEGTPHKSKKSVPSRSQDGVASSASFSPQTPAFNKSILLALENCEPVELVEQLRGEVKPLYAQVK